MTSTKIPRAITVAWLREHAACHDQVAIFEMMFGRSAAPTAANLYRAAAAGLSVWWLARELLDDAARADFDRAIAPARAAYDRARGAAWADFHRAVAAARADYERAVAPAWAEYQRARDAADAEYRRVCAPALAAYERARAAILGRLLGLPGAADAGPGAGDEQNSVEDDDD